ncbi:MAG: hypothetical protein ACK5KU_06835 [Beutenbergiaceae bacterium]
MRFVLPGDEDPEGTLHFHGSLTNVVGALALFGVRYTEAGQGCLCEDDSLDPAWVESVRTELAQHFGAAADGVIEVMTEV